MIHQCKFDFVVSFSLLKEKQPYLPNEVIKMESLTIKVLSRVKMNEHLYRTEISLYNSNDGRMQYQHKVVCFEINFEKIEDDEDEIAVSNLVISSCQIRREMALKNSNLKVLATDTRGGVGASAVFVSMYEIMQMVDNGLTEDGNIKSSADDIDVFAIANRLRKDRAKMFEDFSTYKLLFQCLGYYGLQKDTIKKQISMPRADRYEKSGNQSQSGIRWDNINYLREENNTDEEIEYVIHEAEKIDEDIFDDYYDDSVKPHHNYTNIDEMSEYV